MFTDSYLQTIEKELGLYGSKNDTLATRLENCVKEIQQLKRAKRVKSFLILEEMTNASLRFNFRPDSQFGTVFEKASLLINKIRKAY